jgi:hypothetical protein
VRRPSNQSITRWLVFDFIRRNFNAIAFVLGLVAFLAVIESNAPVSSRIVEGKFVRLTGEAQKGPTAIWVYVDLPDGRTTAVVAWNNWQPPAVGSVIRLEEWTRWFGKSYSLARPS